MRSGALARFGDLLDTLVGRTGTRLAAPSSAGVSDPKSPPIGEDLRQFTMGEGAMSLRVKERIGVFRPQFVGTFEHTLMRLDPQVAFCFAVVRAPIVNLKWAVEGEDPEIKAFIEQQLRPIYRSIATTMSLAIGFGFQVGGKVWKPQPVEFQVEDQDGGVRTVKKPVAWTLDRVKSIDPSTITLLVDPVKDEWAGVEQGTLVGAGSLIKVGPEKAALWSYRKEDVWGRLAGFPLFNQAYEPWYWKAAMQFYTNRYFERRGEPPVKGRVPAVVKRGTISEDGFGWLGRQLEAWRLGGALVLSNERDIQKGEYIMDAELMMDDQRGDMFDGRISSLDLQIAKAMLLTHRVSQAGGSGGIGTGESEMQFDVMESMLESNVAEFLDVLNLQFVRDLVIFNYGEERYRSSKTRVVGAGLSAWMRDLYKELLGKILEAEALVKAGKTINVSDYIGKREVLKQLGIPMLSPEEAEAIAEAREQRRKEFEQGREDAADDEEGTGEVDDEKVADELVRAGNMAARRNGKGED